MRSDPVANRWSTAAARALAWSRRAAEATVDCLESAKSNRPRVGSLLARPARFRIVIVAT
jgi:hypothetical protein